MRKVTLKVYPSGFLGSDTVRTTAPIDLEKQKERFFDLSAITNPDGHTANLEVVRLWNDVIASTELYKTFDFRERILRVAATAFGPHRFMEWVEAQRESPYYNDYHARWMDETLQFIFEGKPRRMSHNNWIDLTQATAGDGRMKDSPIVAKYRQLYAGLTVLDVLGKWCAIKGGIDDIPASLHVLFGHR